MGSIRLFVGFFFFLPPPPSLPWDSDEVKNSAIRIRNLKPPPPLPLRRHSFRKHTPQEMTSRSCSRVNPNPCRNSCRHRKPLVCLPALSGFPTCNASTAQRVLYTVIPSQQRIRYLKDFDFPTQNNSKSSHSSSNLIETNQGIFSRVTLIMASTFAVCRTAEIPAEVPYVPFTPRPQNSLICPHSASNH